MTEITGRFAEKPHQLFHLCPGHPGAGQCEVKLTEQGFLSKWFCLRRCVVEEGQGLLCEMAKAGCKASKCWTVQQSVVFIIGG